MNYESRVFDVLTIGPCTVSVDRSFNSESLSSFKVGSETVRGGEHDRS